MVKWSTVVRNVCAVSGVHSDQRAGRCICKGPTADSPLQLWLGKSSHGSHRPWIASTSLPDCNLALEAALNVPTDLDHFVVREQEKGLRRWLAGDFSRAFGDRARR